MLGFRLFGRGKGQMYRERCRGMGCSVVGDVERIRRVAISDNEAKRKCGWVGLGGGSVYGAPDRCSRG